MEDNDIVESSEQTGDTPVAEESTSQVEASGAETQESAPEKVQEEKPAPFHEHPRFKELIDQNRSYKEQMGQYQQTLERLQQQMETLKQQAPKQEQPKDPFLADLEKVNPAYAKSLQSVYERAAKAEAIEARLAQYEARETANAAISKFNNLLESNKVTDPMDRELYERAVRAEVYEQEARGKKLNLNDLESIFKTFHDKYSKAMEERNRKLTASYVTEKKKDTTPKGTTGGTPAVSTMKKIAATDFEGQKKWLAEELRKLKKPI